jgi:hypothetical protein
MSLIHTCDLKGANPFDYLTELQRHAAELSAHPQVGCRGATATHWYASQHLPQGNMKVLCAGRKLFSWAASSQAESVRAFLSHRKRKVSITNTQLTPDQRYMLKPEVSRCGTIFSVSDLGNP